MFTDFCWYLGVQKKFIFVTHPQANGQAELVNKVILKGLKKKLGDPKGEITPQIIVVMLHHFPLYY